MKLNRGAALAMQGGPFHAATDITGFGFLGHAYEMTSGSSVRLRVRFDDLPFHPGAKEYAEKGFFPGGARRNRQAFVRHIRFASHLGDEMQMLLFTPETSGGLLIAVPRSEVEALLRRLEEEGDRGWVVGEVIEGEGIEVS